MLKVSCIIALERIDRSPRIDHLEIPQTAAAPEQNHLIASTQSVNMQQTCVNECIR
jgi:hypothetical protein